MKLYIIWMSLDLLPLVIYAYWKGHCRVFTHPQDTKLKAKKQVVFYRVPLSDLYRKTKDYKSVKDNGRKTILVIC